MLDHFQVPQGAGFPDHPHRGQETITYLMQGSVDHEDFAGNKGTIGPGDLQFMTAGRGIVSLPECPGNVRMENDACITLSKVHRILTCGRPPQHYFSQTT